MMGSSISIILPTLNETELTQKVELISQHLQGRPHEIIIVDDSPDQVFERISSELAGKNDVRLIKGERKHKGHAVRKGMLESRGSIVFYIDADLRIPLEHIPVFINLIETQNFDVVIAQRPFAQTPRSRLRSIFSASLVNLTRLLVFNSGAFDDTQCGFKAFKGDLARQMGIKQIIDGGMVDVEYLYMARFNRWKIDTVAIVPLPEIRPSRINIWRCIFYDVIDLLRIKIKGMEGYYKIQ